MSMNYGSKWEPDWVRCYSKGQADQGEVLDNCCHVISALGILHSNDYIITGISLILYFSKIELRWKYLQTSIIVIV